LEGICCRRRFVPPKREDVPGRNIARVQMGNGDPHTGTVTALLRAAAAEVRGSYTI